MVKVQRGLAISALLQLILSPGFNIRVRAQTQERPLTVNWTRFSSEEGGFSVKLPSNPVPVTSKGRLLGIDVTVNGIKCSYSKDESLVVAYSDLPLMSPRELLLVDLARGHESRATTQGGKAVSNTAISQGGCEGREVVTRGPDSEFQQTRIFISGNRIYHVAFLSASESQATPKVAGEYLDSFEVTGGCKPLPASAVAPRLAGASVIISGSKDPETGWERITAENDGFSILAPASVSMMEQRAEVNGNAVLRHAYTSLGSTCTTVVVTIAGTDPRPNSGITPQSVLDGMANPILYELRQTGMEVDFAREVQIGGNHGREYNINAHGQNGRLQIYITGKRLLAFMAICKDAAGCREVLDRFFRSIRITEH